MNISLNFPIQISRFKKSFLLFVGGSLFAHHLTQYENYLFNPNYEFPIVSLVTSFIIGIPLLFLMEFFYHKTQKYFPVKNLKFFFHFLLKVELCALVIYLPVYSFIVWQLEGSMSFFFLLQGIFLSTIVLAAFVLIIYGNELLPIFRKDANVLIKSNDLIISRPVTDISYFYTKNKLVHAVYTDSTEVRMESTLEKLEKEFIDYNFFRINRQTLVSLKAIEKIKKIENQKVQAFLKPAYLGEEEVIVSRYKSSIFKKWLKESCNHSV